MSNKAFLWKLIVFVLLLYAADSLVGSGLKYLYFHQQEEDFYYTTKTLDIQDSAIVILGSSRARNHYNPQIISDSLGMSCYNAGRSGCFLPYQRAQLDMMLDRYRPKVIVLEVTPYDMNPGNGDYERLSGLLPYKHHASWREVIERKSALEPYKCLSAIYPYNSLLLKMLTNLKPRGEFSDNGFQPLDGQWNGVYADTDGGGSEVASERKRQEMEHIVEVCRQRHIQLLMVTSPYYGHFTSAKTLEVTDSICKANDIPYLSMLNNPAFDDDTCFFTADHLNRHGADKFSSMVAHWMKSHIRE